MKKDETTKSVLVRFPKTFYDRLLQARAVASKVEGKPVSLSKVILVSLQKVLR